MDDTLAHAQNQVTILRQENDRQVELLQSSRHALSDLRSRYDKGLEGWTKEKNHLEKRIKQVCLIFYVKSYMHLMYYGFSWT